MASGSNDLLTTIGLIIFGAFVFYGALLWAFDPLRDDEDSST